MIIDMTIRIISDPPSGSMPCIRLFAGPNSYQNTRNIRNPNGSKG